MKFEFFNVSKIGLQVARELKAFFDLHRPFPNKCRQSLIRSAADGLFLSGAALYTSAPNMRLPKQRKICKLRILLIFEHSLHIIDIVPISKTTKFNYILI
jgi:hypothetical protein